MPAATNTWTATANDAWLHLDAPSQSGSGSANVVFSYDANPGGTRTGTVTIACQTLTVTQAGATYVLAPCPVTTLVSSGLSNPAGVAVDGAGNVLYCGHGQQRDQEVVAGEQHRYRAGGFRIERSFRRGGGSGGQCVYCRLW